MKKQITYLILQLLQLNLLLAQNSPLDTTFLKSFQRSNSQTKLQLLADVDYLKIKDYYPFIEKEYIELKNSIEHIPLGKQEHSRFLIESFEAKKELAFNHPDKAIYLLKKSLQNHTRSVDDSLRCLVLMKEVFLKTKNTIRAFEIHSLIEKNWHKKSKHNSLDIGARRSKLFYLMGMHQEAILELRKEFNEEANNHDTTDIVNFHNALGVFYNQQKQSDSARNNLLLAKKYLNQKSVNNIKSIDKDFYDGLIDGNIALSYYNEGKINEAIPLLKNDCYRSMKAEKFQSAFNAYHYLVKCYLQLNDKRNSLAYADTALYILTYKYSDLTLKRDFLPTLAGCYLINNNYKKASETFHSYYILNDSLVRSENELIKFNQGLTYNINQREIALEEQNQREQEMKLEEAREKNFRISVLSGLMILLIIIFFLSINNRRIKMREKQLSIKNVQIQNQNTQIEHTLKEKEALIKEIHHRVKNNLQIITSMLNLQVGRIDDAKTEQIFYEARQRINAIALTHQMLYQRSTISEVNLKEYVQGLVNQIEASVSVSRIKIKTNLNIEDETLSIDSAVPLGLIINELLTNSYKHAFPIEKEGEISVSIENKKQSLLIKVSDNGIGLPEDFKIDQNRSLGMELILILIEQLESKLIVENKNGTTFSFEIKKHQSIERS